MQSQETTVDVTAFTALRKLMEEKVELEKDYTAKKEIASAAYEKLEAVKHKILEYLKAANLDNHKVPGLGTAYIISKLAVTTPKTIEEKRELFEYIRKNHGDDALTAYLSINHNSLNAFYNQEAERHKEDPLFSVPGIGEPVLNESLGWRKA